MIILIVALKKLIMRHLIFTTLFLSICFFSSAQITLTADVHNPNVGDAFEQNINSDPGSGFNEGPSGANVTWDFSNLTASTTRGVTIQEADNPDFPNADIFYSQVGTYSYFGTTNDAFVYWGIFTDQAVIAYTDGEDQVRFPLTYGDSYSDTFSGSYESFGMTFDREGTVNVEADAYGTLITPDATYSNALRIQIVRNTTDYQDGTPSGSTVDTIYYWYAGDINFPVMTYFRNYSEGSLVGESVNYLTDDGSLAINNTEMASFKVYPNPASNSLNLTYDNQQVRHIQIIDVQGRLVKQFSGKVERILTSNLTAGTYFVKITYENNTSKKAKFIKQ